MVKKKTDTENTVAQENEFKLNRMGFYCKVRTLFNKSRGKNDYLFSIVQYEDGKEKVIQEDKKPFSCGELEAIKERDIAIQYYLNKLKNE